MSRQQHLKMPCNMPGPRKSHEDLSVASHLGACPKPRYQNFEKEMQMEQDPAYVEPIHANHHNYRKDLRTPSDEDFPYQNVAGPCGSNACVLVNADVYENSPIIQLWKNSQIAENLSSDDEPDYINANTNHRFPA
ncbi:linker for activation of T-cells family member 2-like isoform X2 [Sceloporus undulatus]|uniref:linker for activation of T-cells family member 2-like isoform X2 n=1 Tax=Sceloporus undulatus TaxID=8520 RepID=UPI001C4D362D|nr:linker for activation of T-cells family member 2-like isoform X2 [Sceloporus undulatus]